MYSGFGLPDVCAAVSRRIAGAAWPEEFWPDSSYGRNNDSSPIANPNLPGIEPALLVGSRSTPEHLRRAPHHRRQSDQAGTDEHEET